MQRISIAPPHPRTEEIRDAWLVLRGTARRLNRIAKEEGWPTPFAPARYLILTELMRGTDYGFSARRIARGLSMVPSTLSHHIDVLMKAGLVTRAEWKVHDRRKVAVRITAEGIYAVRRLTAVSATGSTSSSSSP